MTTLGIELAVYILIAAMLFIYRTVLSGRKNGCFYHKNDVPPPPLLKREIENLHFIETPAWYAQSGGIFLLLLGIIRSVDHSMNWLDILYQISIVSLITFGTIQAASYHYQRGITAGLKDDDHLDAMSKSEIAIYILKVHIQFWKPRVFNNKGRIIAQWAGIIEILVGVTLLILEIK